jgi:hypothetical protein
VDISLLTVGCPLCQLYTKRFPDLYGWVTGIGGPEIQALGVKIWVNDYRSGDYVGRALWSDVIQYPTFLQGPAPNVVITNSQYQSDFCVGAGAHTRYFDHTAPEVAAAIDALLV